MKGIFSLLLASLFTLQSLQINMSDFNKIIDLVEHASYHSEAYGDGWFTFFSKHYGDLKEDHKRTHEHEKEQHSKLPNINHFFSATNIFIVNQIAIDFKSPEASTKEVTFFYLSLYHFQDLVDIFQPPRL